MSGPPVGARVLKDLVSSSEQEWFARMERIGRQEGFFARLGLDHAALFADREPTLVVTFETVESIRRRQPEQVPLGLSVCENRDWSHLCLIARTESWYRDPEVIAFFDSLVDDGFFDNFDNVVFYGAGMAGYAAAAFSVAAPGATVILVQPQATLSPAVAGWDMRFVDRRRMDFTTRYGYAPDMVDGAAAVYVAYDPAQSYDAMHAALFRGPQVTHLRCRNIGPDLAGMLGATHVLPSVLAAAGNGTFDARLFWTFFRVRRNHTPYLRRLLSRLETSGRVGLAAFLAGNAGERLNDDRFRKRARELSQRFRRTRLLTPGEPAPDA